MDMMTLIRSRKDTMGMSKIDTEKTKTQKPGAPPTRTAQACQAAKKADCPRSRPADSANKKAKVMAMMNPAKGATLPEIMKGHGLAAAHSVGLRQRPEQQGWGKDRVVQGLPGRAGLQDRQVRNSQANVHSKRRFREYPDSIPASVADPGRPGK
jgi:hypothetical protein